MKAKEDVGELQVAARKLIILLPNYSGWFTIYLGYV